MKRLLILLILLASGAARAEMTYRWAWIEPPDPAALSLVLDEMEKIAAMGAPAGVRTHRGDDTLTITAAPDGDSEDFVFSGRPGTVTTNAEIDAQIVEACLGAARARFGTNLRVWVKGREREAAAFGGESLTGLLFPGLMAIFFIVMMARGGGSWTSYYLFWWVAPVVAFTVLRQPLLLLLVPVAVIARRVLPDPIQLIRRGGRIRALSADVDANPSNVTARRALAMLWLDLRRPRKALPLVEQALQREPEDAELHHLRGLSLLGVRRWQPALDSFLAVLEREPRLRYGDAYLRGADALLKLGRPEEAAEGLEHFTQVNKSTVEGWVKLAQARRAQGDDAGAAEAIAQAKATYKGSPAFHRRKQLWWYLRALAGR